MTRKYSRTKNTVFNFATSVGAQGLHILMQFIIRTVFIRTLGPSLLGVNGLFTNVLTMLSLTEFGVGSAILYKLYKPIADDDKHRIAVLMKFYKSIYRIIGLSVAVLGLCLIPFLPYLIKDYYKLETLGVNAAFIFVIYLARTVSSYVFFAYKSAIIKANQKEYLINLIGYIFTILGAILQIVFLLVYPRFEVYAMISVVQILMQNVAIAVSANKMYPYINEKTTETIEKREVIGLFKDCGALFLYKLNGVVLKATDNIVLSICKGLDMVALYSNYYVFYTTIYALFQRVFDSVSHSLGNLHTTKNREHEYQVFEIVNFITAILGGTAFVGVFVVSDEFVLRWIGRQWVLSQPFAFLMGFEIYTLASRVALSKYRTTMGLFQQAKWRPVAGMIINLLVSIALVNVWGICGVLVGTLVSEWTIFMWFDPLIIHKYGFKNFKPVSSYYKRLLLYTFVVISVGFGDLFICRHFFVGYGWFSIVVHAIICGISVPSILILIMMKRQEGQYILGIIRKILNRSKVRSKDRSNEKV